MEFCARRDGSEQVGPDRASPPAPGERPRGARTKNNPPLPHLSWCRRHWARSPAASCSAESSRSCPAPPRPREPPTPRRAPACRCVVPCPVQVGWFNGSKAQRFNGLTVQRFWPPAGGLETGGSG